MTVSIDRSAKLTLESFRKTAVRAEKVAWIIRIERIDVVA